MMKQILFLLFFLGAAVPGVVPAAPITNGLAPSVRALPDFSSLAVSSGPVVVNISTTQNLNRAELPGVEPPEAPFNDFLRRYFGDEDPPPEFFENKSLGSGFIISADGYVLTCAHVVENATEILVRLTDRRELVAKVVGADKRSDVALLKLEAKGLPVARIGDPGRVRVGEWVLAIGSPFGFENSVTAGIVSAKGRSLPSENYVPFIQSDVAINPGNSGGPLFNLRGEVIGVNSQIYSRTGGFMGLSFAVPIDIAMKVAQQLKVSGRVKRGWLGVTIQDVTRDLAESFGMKHPAGALIADILPGSPAAKSDLRVGDIVMEYDGTRIDSSADLPPLVGQMAPGTRARLMVLRNRQPRNLLLAIAELPEESAAPQPAPPSGVEQNGVLGMQLKDLTAVQRKQLGVTHGVAVEKVADGPGLRAGLRPGDILLQLGGKAVRSIAEFRDQATQQRRNHPAPLLVRRGSTSLFLALRIPD